MRPVFSTLELKHIAELLHEAEPFARPLFEVAKHLMLAVCFKMVLRDGKVYTIIPPSPEAKRLFSILAGAHIVEEADDGIRGEGGRERLIYCTNTTFQDIN